MPTQQPNVSLFLLLGDILFYLVWFLFALLWRGDRICTVGSIIALPAFALWLFAKIQLGRSFTARAEARELVTRGLFAHVRHPIHLFSTFALIGTAICWRSIYFTAYLLLVIGAQIWRIGREERVLKEKFGQTYLDYRARTWF